MTPATWNGKRLRHTWEYRDRNGAVLGSVARFDGDDGDKDVIPFFGTNGKAQGPAEPKPLFGLHSLQQPRDTAYVCEGEKCGAALHSLGLQAVSCIGGGKSADKADWTPLAPFQRVVLLPDYDEPGEAYARDVAGILAGLPGSRQVEVSYLPELPPGGDVVDWLQARIPGWDGFEPIPREPGDGLLDDFLESVQSFSVPVPTDWCEAETPEAAPWETPVPLTAAAVPAWPSGVFPERVQSFVDALADATETPRELSSMLALAVLATCSQGKFRVRVKQDYFEPLSLWTCTALPSGQRKTAVHNEVTRPLAEWEHRERARVEPEIRDAESRKKTLEGCIEALRKKASKTKGEDLADLMREIAVIEHDIPEVPTLPTVWTQDITPEHVAVLMETNKERLALLSDEGGILDTLAGRYSGGIPNLDVFLQGHAGSPVRVHRGSRPAVYLRRPCLSIGLSPQPDVVSAMANTAAFRGRGLLGRFLYAMPESNLGRRTGNAPPIPEHVTAGWTATVYALLDAPSSVNDDGEPCAHVLKLTPGAADIWRAFARTVEAGLAPGGTFEYVTDWGGKLPGAVARIAGVMHCARHAHGEPWRYDIGGPDMAAAVTLGDVLSKHALIAFDTMGADAALDDARAILEWTIRERLSLFTARDALRGNRRFQRAADLDGPLDVLVERGHIRSVLRPTTKAGGRPTLQYDVNPAHLKVTL
jgi:hypothetical protein